MESKKIIEMICKGNVGRSPVAELVARQYLQSTGAFEDYEVSSSGSIANLLLDRKITREMLANSMNLFSNTGLHDESFDLLREAWRQEDAEKIKTYTARAIDFTIAAEIKKRDQILQELGVAGTAKKYPEQTRIRDVDYIFAIDRKVYADLTGCPNGIYYNAQVKPQINVLSVFATGNQEEKDSEVDLTRPENVWQSYREGLARIVEHTPLAMKKVIGV